MLYWLFSIQLQHNSSISCRVPKADHHIWPDHVVIVGYSIDDSKHFINTDQCPLIEKLGESYVSIFLSVQHDLNTGKRLYSIHDTGQLQHDQQL